LEPWVMLHAQKVSGIDFADLLVDWFRSSPGRDDAVVIAAAQRHYLDVRERLVEAAGATLCALGDAAAAALGACRCVVSRCLHTTPDEDADPALGPLLYPAPIKGARFVGAPQAGAGDAARRAMTVLGQGQGQGPDEAVIAPCYASEQSAAYAPRLSARRVFDAQFNTQRFAAVWLGETAWRAWAFEANGAALERLPVPVARDPHQWMKVLRDYAPKGLALALVSGEIALLEPAGGIRALGASLGCPAIEFDASACCVGPGATPQQLGPSASVAFGLALRELMR